MSQLFCFSKINIDQFIKMQWMPAKCHKTDKLHFQGKRGNCIFTAILSNFNHNHEKLFIVFFTGRSGGSSKRAAGAGGLQV
jgi:hypothetical protein